MPGDSLWHTSRISYFKPSLQCLRSGCTSLLDRMHSKALVRIFLALEFILVIFLQLWPVNGETSKTCKPKDQCSCILDDGSEISLWPIDSKNGPRFVKVIPGGSTFQYNPCTPFTTNGQGCSKALVCQLNTQTLPSTYTALAYPDHMTATYDAKLKGFQFSYDGASILGGKIRQSIGSKSIIKLKCDQNAENPTITQFIQSFPYIFTTTLTSKYACPVSSKGLSAGSLLCILFFAFVLAYLLIGIIINKFIMHKEGSDVVPQKLFWISLPGYVKDGFIFTFRTIRGKGSQYEKL